MEQKITLAEKTVVRILLIIAKFLAPSGWQEEIKNLANHINANFKE